MEIAVHRSRYRELPMEHPTSTERLVYGGVMIGWLLGISTMLLLGYNPDNCMFIQ